MDILFHLREFLQNHKTISIDGLGTLYKRKSPGKYDVDTHAFLPPSYALTFTNEVDEPEIFVNFIAESENIDNNAAKLQINEFVENIHTQLKDKQEFALNDFGKFILVNDEITFSTSGYDNFGNEFYGLPTLTEITEPIEQTMVISEVASDQKDTNTPVAESASTTHNIENQTSFVGKPFTPNYEDDDDSIGEMSKPVKILLRILSVLAIIASIIGLAYFFKPDFFDKTINSNEVEPTPTALILPNDSLNNENEQLNPDSNATINLDSNDTILKKLPTIDSSITTYEVIGSAEKNQKRIDLVINTMKKRGIEAKALEDVPGKLTKISLGSFTDFNLAKKYKDSLRKKLNNPEIYIHTIKPKK